jgi:hypothetical protein
VSRAEARLPDLREPRARWQEPRRGQLSRAVALSLGDHTRCRSPATLSAQCRRRRERAALPELCP